MAFSNGESRIKLGDADLGGVAARNSWEIAVTPLRSQH